MVKRHKYSKKNGIVVVEFYLKKGQITSGTYLNKE